MILTTHRWFILTTHIFIHFNASQFDKAYANRLWAIGLKSGPVILFLETQGKER